MEGHQRITFSVFNIKQYSKDYYYDHLKYLCRYRSVVARGIGVIPTSTNEAYEKAVGVTGGGGIPTSTNEAYGKVVGEEREEGYEMVKISHREPPPPPAKLEEIPLSPAPPASPSPPSLSLPLLELRRILMSMRSFLEISDYV